MVGRGAHPGGGLDRQQNDHGKGATSAVLRGSSRKRAAGILFCTVRVYRQVTNVINVGQL